MTATYDITTAVGQVRLKIGDTDVTPAADAVFTDEEISYFLGLHDNNTNLASVGLLKAWVAKYATNADSEKIGDYSYTQKAVANLLKLASDLQAQEDGVPVLSWAEMNLTEGSGITAEED